MVAVQEQNLSFLSQNLSFQCQDVWGFQVYGAFAYMIFHPSSLRGIMHVKNTFSKT